MEEVVVTDAGVTRRASRLFRRNINEAIAWADLSRVEVISWFSVTAKDDLYFLLIDDNERGVAVGLSDALATGLFDRLQHLPGFDNEAATAAAGAQMRAVLWTRIEDPPGPGIGHDSASKVPLWPIATDSRKMAGWRVRFAAVEVPKTERAGPTVIMCGTSR